MGLSVHTKFSATLLSPPQPATAFHSLQLGIQLCGDQIGLRADFGTCIGISQISDHVHHHDWHLQGSRPVACLPERIRDKATVFWVFVDGNLYDSVP